MGIKNAIDKLKKTLVNSYQFVGVIASINEAEGTAVVTTPEGGSMKVRVSSGYNINDKVEVRDGVIISIAPVASYYEFNV